MRIKQLIRNEQEHREFAWSFLRFLHNDENIWKKEDLGKVQAYWDSNAYPPKVHMYDEETVMESHRHYLKCKEEYVDEDTQKMMAVLSLDSDEICEEFGFIPFKHGEEFPKVTIETMELDPDLVLTYPIVIAGVIGDVFILMESSPYINLTIVSEADFID